MIDHLQEPTERLWVLIDDGTDGPNLLSKKFGLGNQSLVGSAISRHPFT